jgi:hypothetical protein
MIGIARRGMWVTRFGLALAAAGVGVAMLVSLTALDGRTGTTPRYPGQLMTAGRTHGDAPPVYAYFYQWFSASSWDRAKDDYPLAGRYSSDDATVIAKQVHEARNAGLDGFLTSWKDTPQLDRRLDRLLRVSVRWHFDIGVVYEALDFYRRPLPVSTVEHDLTLLVDRWGTRLTSSFYDRPLIIWTGIDEYSRAEVQRVRDALGDQALLLASAKQVADYDRIADLVDGEAYYWSSADPTSSLTPRKLGELSADVHAHGGIWMAPATCGYDGTTLGHTRVVPRDHGQTLLRSLDLAYASRPDGVAVISWNEWSENTYIEPGQRYGDEELTVLRRYIASRTSSASSDDNGAKAWPGLRAVVILFMSSALATVLVRWVLHLGRLRSTERRPDHMPNPLAAVPKGYHIRLTSRPRHRAGSGSDQLIHDRCYQTRTAGNSNCPRSSEPAAADLASGRRIKDS